MTRLPFGPAWPADRDDVVYEDDRPSLADVSDDTPPGTPRRTGPIPPPCPVCLSHGGHYEERHGGAA